MSIKVTDDGSHTLFVPGIGEHYHSVRGALTESLHIFIHHGFNHFKKDSITVFEMGFGTGLNAFLTFLETEKRKIYTTYYSIELYPLGSEVYSQLNYPVLISGNNSLSGKFMTMHTCKWNTLIRISSRFTLFKIQGNILDYKFLKGYDVVYFDAFAPDKQPEVWDAAVFEKIYQHLSPGGNLTTYSVKGEIRRRLQRAGFIVEKLPGPSDKREITRAEKI